MNEEELHAEVHGRGKVLPVPASGPRRKTVGLGGGSVQGQGQGQGQCLYTIILHMALPQT